MKGKEEEKEKPRNPVKAGRGRKMDLDTAVEITGRNYQALWSNDEREIQRHVCNEGNCGQGFHMR